MKDHLPISQSRRKCLAIPRERETICIFRNLSQALTRERIAQMDQIGIAPGGQSFSIRRKRGTGDRISVVFVTRNDLRTFDVPEPNASIPAKGDEHLAVWREGDAVEFAD